MLSSPPPVPHPAERVRVGLFFAFFPPPSVAARIAELAGQLQRVHRLHGTPTAPERLHCTLHPIDLRKREFATAVTRARDAAERVRAEPFDVAFDHSGSFRGSHGYPFVLRGSRNMAGLIAFRRALGTAMFTCELKDAVTTGFTPHVTMLYGADRLVENHPISPIRWRVDEFKLIVSAHGHGHRLAGCWPLRG